ncbi:MAG: alpha/beta hydrolase [Chloroflexaceae bacterium]|jgi:pimeloyl-ACP methyl ester carboxylesterase|nr:alpha/beta hydrolase [Chloroflexaceae bacterium]
MPEYWNEDEEKGLGHTLLQVGKVAGAVGLAAPLLWIGYSALFVDHAMPLEPAIPADLHSFHDPEAGRLCYYADRSGTGRPLVLLHSINAGASAYEMRPLFEHFRGRRPVYALDLPGFGFSERSDRSYTPELYRRAIVALLRHEIQADEGVDVIALSLTCEFTAQAAVEHPDLFNTITLIAPSGFSKTQQTSSQTAHNSGVSSNVYRVLSNPLWSQAIYDALATRPSIWYFLKRSFAGAVDDGLLDYDYRSTHQPGAKHAPLYFVSGLLFTADIRQRTYSRVQQPALVIYDECPFVGFDKLGEFCSNHPNWQAVKISGTKGLPHFESLDQTVQSIESFWASSTEREIALGESYSG